VIRDHKVDAIIHFSATLIMPEHYARPLEYYRINSAQSRGLLQAASDNGVTKFIFSATSAVYGNPVSNPVSEAAVIAPVSPYGK
jgi:UDP-glucose 4-epimerase